MVKATFYPISVDMPIELKGSFSMLKTLLVATVLAVPFPAVAQQVYHISGWPQGINDLPCSAFRKNPNGSWTLVATVVMPGNVSLSDITVSGGREVERIEAKCGSKSPQQ
jgi:hypothetical protein